MRRLRRWLTILHLRLRFRKLRKLLPAADYEDLRTMRDEILRTKQRLNMITYYYRFNEETKPK